MQTERESLRSTCAILGLPDVTEAQLSLLQGYLDLLQRWNATYNLTAVRDRSAMLTQHLADCLAVVPSLTRHLSVSGRVLDVGSGGGLPGLVLAIMRPALRVTCVDTVGKKAAFIRQAAGALALPNVMVEHARVENLQQVAFDVVTSRAFATLTDLVRLTRQVLAPQGVWMAMKSKSAQDEIALLTAGIEVFHVEQLQVPGLEAERCLVWMRPRTA